MMKNQVLNSKGLYGIQEEIKGNGTRWMFKNKKDRVYIPILVTNDCSQQAGVDLDYFHAPFLNKLTLRVILIFWVANDYYAEVTNIQTAFLHNHLVEELFP
jgi:hypothetical protein